MPAETEQPRVAGMEAVKAHILQHKIDMALWSTRFLAILFTFLYFIPIVGNPYNYYYKVLLANAATSTLRLNQRLPAYTQFSEFLASVMREDSCHYLIFSLLFLNASPFSLTLLPIFLFSLIHFASYSLALLDVLGQNSWWGARLFISLIEFQSRNILNIIACCEILLMPFIFVLVFTGRAGLFTPFLYYQFLILRYKSNRNPYTRNMFAVIRASLEDLAAHQMTPGVVKTAIQKSIEVVCRLGPAHDLLNLKRYKCIIMESLPMKTYGTDYLSHSLMNTVLTAGVI